MGDLFGYKHDGKALGHHSFFHQHEQIHTVEKPYACDEHGQEFSPTANLYVH